MVEEEFGTGQRTVRKMRQRAGRKNKGKEERTMRRRKKKGGDYIVVSSLTFGGLTREV
jgi:hypothetical protein